MADLRPSYGRAHSSKFPVDISMSPSARSTEPFVLLMLTLFLVLCASSLSRACAIVAPVTVMLMLNCANVVVKIGFNVHCFFRN